MGPGRRSAHARRGRARRVVGRLRPASGAGEPAPIRGNAAATRRTTSRRSSSTRARRAPSASRAGRVSKRASAKRVPLPPIVGHRGSVPERPGRPDRTRGRALDPPGAPELHRVHAEARRDESSSTSRARHGRRRRSSTSTRSTGRWPVSEDAPSLVTLLADYRLEWQDGAVPRLRARLLGGVQPAGGPDVRRATRATTSACLRRCGAGLGRARGVAVARRTAGGARLQACASAHRGDARGRPDACSIGSSPVSAEPASSCRRTSPIGLPSRSSRPPRGGRRSRATESRRSGSPRSTTTSVDISGDVSGSFSSALYRSPTP